MEHSWGKAIPLGVGGILVLLLANTGVSLFNICQLQSYAIWVAHTHEVRYALDELVSTVKEAESAQRGYIITGDASFLKAYDSARGSVPGQIDRVAYLTRNNARQQAALPGMRASIAAKLERMQYNVALCANDREAARASVATNIGQRLMKAAVEYVERMKALEQELLEQRQRRLDSIYAVGVATTTVGGVLGLVSILAFVGLLWHHFQTQGRRTARLRLLSDIMTRLLASNQSLQRVEELCRDVMQYLDCQVLLHYLVDDATGQLRLNACAGISDEMARRLEWQEPGRAVCGQAGPCGCGMRLEEGKCEQDEQSALLAELGIRVFLCRPLVNQGRMVGTLMFASRTRNKLGPDDVTLIGTVTDHVALAVQRMRLLDQLQRHVREAQEANAAKSRFLANISHELRTPMHAILGMTELALDAPSLPPAREYLAIAKESAEGLLELLNGILEFARLEAGQIPLQAGPFSLRNVLWRTVTTLGMRAYEKGLELAVEIPHDMPDAFLGDSLQLRQVLFNLLGNAIKFTLRGEVLLRVSGADRGAGKLLVEFAVQDTGIGIAAEDQQKIFAPFSQADSSTTPRYGGTGLGLTISARLVEAMGGRIWLESVLGQGSTFHFTLPLQLGPTAAEPAADVAEDAQPLRGLEALVVVANPTNRRILASMLRGWQMEPRVASGAQEASVWLEEASASGRPIPLAIIDPASGDRLDFSQVRWIREHPHTVKSLVVLVPPVLRQRQRRELDELQATCAHKPLWQANVLAAIRHVQGVSERSDAKTPPAAAPSPASRPLRILVVEDVPSIQKFLAQVLRERGHVVAVAGDGIEALERCGRETFDLILMDLQMPRLDGLQAARAIRGTTPAGERHTPIVALTAYMLRDDANLLSAGIDGYLQKPISARQLIECVQRHAGLPVVPTTNGQSSHEEDAATQQSDAGEQAYDFPQALAMLGGQEERFREMAVYFLRESPGLLDAVRQGVRTCDAALVASKTHKFRNTLFYLGAVPALEAIAEVEDVAAAGDWQSAGEPLLMLENAIAHLQRALGAYAARRAVVSSPDA